MTVPKPTFKQGDRISNGHYGLGYVTGRTFDNLLHATQWRYAIAWDSGKHTNHHYCQDIDRVTANQPAQ